MNKLGAMRSLITSGLVVLAFPFCLGIFSFLVAFLGMSVVPVNQRSGMTLLVFSPMVTIKKDVSSDVVLEWMSNVTILTELYVVLAWILAGGLSLAIGFLLPRFQFVAYLLMSLIAMSHAIVQSLVFQLPVWMPIVGVLGLGTLAFLMALLTSRVKIIRDDWLFQKLGLAQSNSEFVISESSEVKKIQRLFSIWNWLFLLGFSGWILYVVVV